MEEGRSTKLDMEQSAAASPASSSTDAGVDLFGHQLRFVWSAEDGPFPTVQYSTDGIVTLTRRKTAVAAVEGALESTQRQQ
jgi:hypothetical protein